MILEGLIGIKFFHLLLAMTVGILWWAILRPLLNDGELTDIFVHLMVIAPVVGITWMIYGAVCWFLTGFLF